jgi:hypothetical protein
MTKSTPTPKRNPRIGSSLDEFLAEKGLLDATRDVAVAEVDEWIRENPEAAVAQGGDRPAKAAKRRKATA